MRRQRKVAIASALTCCVVSGAGQALAADEGDASKPKARESEAIQTIVVTAEKRAQNLQTVPASIQAFSAEALEKAGITSAQDLPMLTPGLVTGNMVSYGEFYIRGIGSDIVGAGFEPAVAFYLDGVYQARPFSSLFQFIDVDRVEVLKGPQGTLYGRNASGGAINVISRAPSRAPEGQFDFEIGRFNARATRGTFSGPIAEGTAYARLSFNVRNDDGYTYNRLLKQRGNAADSTSVRGAVEFTPSKRLSVVLNALHAEDNSNPVVKALYPAVNPVYTTFGAEYIADPFTVSQNHDNRTEITQKALSATIKYDFDTVQLTSVSAFGRGDWLAHGQDTDGSNIDIVAFAFPGSPEKSKSRAQDFTLASSAPGPFQWTALASFYHQSVDADLNIAVPLVPVQIRTVSALTTDAWGVGGQASYAFDNGFKLTAGTRFSHEEKRMDGTGTAGGFVTGTQHETKTWSASTPKIVAEYTARPGLMYFASASKGFKSGGFNAVTLENPYNPEKVTNLEMGLKSSLLNRRLIFNATAFHSKYKDMQAELWYSPPGGGVVAVTRNAAQSTSKGIEVDVTAKPSTRLTLTGGIQLMKARYDEFVTVSPTEPGAGAIDRAGNPLMRAPDQTATLSAEYVFPDALPNADIVLRGDGYYRSRIYWNPYKNPLSSDAQGTVWNAQVSVEPTSGTGWYAALFVKNISDKTYKVHALASALTGYGAIWAPPRTFGLRVGYRY